MKNQNKQTPSYMMNENVMLLKMATVWHIKGEKHRQIMTVKSWLLKIKGKCGVNVYKYIDFIVVSVQDAANLATIDQQKNTFKQPDK